MKGNAKNLKNPLFLLRDSFKPFFKTATDPRFEAAPFDMLAGCMVTASSFQKQ